MREEEEELVFEVRVGDVTYDLRLVEAIGREIGEDIKTMVNVIAALQEAELEG